MFFYFLGKKTWSVNVEKTGECPTRGNILFPSSNECRTHNRNESHQGVWGVSDGAHGWWGWVVDALCSHVGIQLFLSFNIFVCSIYETGFLDSYPPEKRLKTKQGLWILSLCKSPPSSFSVFDFYLKIPFTWEWEGILVSCSRLWGTGEGGFGMFCFFFFQFFNYKYQI